MTMTSFPVPPERDPARPQAAPAVRITLDGRPLTGVAGQTIAGIALANGHLAWRRTSRTGRPRGLFCGIGVCFDCLVVVNGLRDVRACRRRAQDGDEITVQYDPLPVAARPKGTSDAPGGRDAEGAVDAQDGSDADAASGVRHGSDADRAADVRGGSDASDGSGDRPDGPGSGGRRDG